MHTVVELLSGPFKRWQENIQKSQKSPPIDRKYDLWTYPVELLFTMNEPQIKEVFKFLTKNQEECPDKPFGMEIVTLQDVKWFFKTKLRYR